MLTKYITFTGFNYIFNIFFFFYEKGTCKEVENETINKEILEIRKQVLTTYKIDQELHSLLSSVDASSVDNYQPHLHNNTNKVT